ncbi:MAG: hypothetical protein AAF360_02410 [Pseudomonadota bacterium]
MSRQLQDGAVDAVSNYWHFVARLEAAGAKRLIGVDEAMAELGVAPAPAMIGFVWEAGTPDQTAVDGFLRAIAAAGAALAADDAAWEEVRPLMRADDEAAFVALRDAYRAGIPGPWSAQDTAAAARLYEILVIEGGAAFAATAGPFDPAAFSVGAE